MPHLGGMIRLPLAVVAAFLLACNLSGGAEEPADPAPSYSALLAADGGVRLVDPASGADSLVAYGTPEAAAVAAITDLAGAMASSGTNEECGAGPVDFATWDSGFQTLSQGGSFGGWSLRDGPAADAPPEAEGGLSIGMTRTALDAVAGLNVFESTLGTEFTVGAISGILTGPGPTDTVSNLWSGLSCNFR